MDWTCIAPPSVEPISLAEIKEFLRLEHTLDDQLLAGYIKTAGTLVESFIGHCLINRSYQGTTSLSHPAWEMKEGYPALKLPYVPVVALDSIKIGNEPLAAPFYELVPHLGGAYLVIKGGVGYEALLTITYQAGYGPQPEHIPFPLKQALIMIVRQLYEGTSEQAEKGHPLGAVFWLLNPYRFPSLS